MSRLPFLRYVLTSSPIYFFPPDDNSPLFRYLTHSMNTPYNRLAGHSVERLAALSDGIFAIAMVAETNRAPFDLPEAESELTAGFHTEYSGFRWSLFFLAEYSAMIAVSSIAVTLWLGGWMRPFPNALSGETWDLVFSLVPGLTFLFLAALTFYSTARMPKHPLFRVQTIGLGGFGAVLALIGVILFLPPVRDRVQDIFWFSTKVAVSMYMYIWYRGTFPRYRFDQLMKVGWKILLPVGIGVLLLTAVAGVLFA